MQTLKKSQSKKGGIKLKIPTDVSFIRLVRLIIAARLREQFAEEEAIDDLKLVLSEFLAKAIEANLAENYFSITLYFDSNNIFEIIIENLEEFDPQQLFNSPYLNFKAISAIVDDFDLQLTERQLFTVRIAKQINLEAKGQNIDKFE